MIGNARRNVHRLRSASQPLGREEGWEPGKHRRSISIPSALGARCVLLGLRIPPTSSHPSVGFGGAYSYSCAAYSSFYFSTHPTHTPPSFPLAEPFPSSVSAQLQPETSPRRCLSDSVGRLSCEFGANSSQTIRCLLCIFIGSWNKKVNKAVQLLISSIDVAPSAICSLVFHVLYDTRIKESHLMDV